MSILVKGMEMPKEGRLTLQISADGAVYVVNRCNITAVPLIFPWFCPARRYGTEPPCF